MSFCVKSFHVRYLLDHSEHLTKSINKKLFHIQPSAKYISFDFNMN